VVVRFETLGNGTAVVVRFDAVDTLMSRGANTVVVDAGGPVVPVVDVVFGVMVVDSVLVGVLLVLDIVVEITDVVDGVVVIVLVVAVVLVVVDDTFAVQGGGVGTSSFLFVTDVVVVALAMVVQVC